MNLIVACDPNGGIGYKNRLPWEKLEGDLPRFKSLTYNQTVVMGRNTWESLPVKPLPNRKNVVLTRSNIEYVPSEVVMTSRIEVVDDDAWMIGGASVIESFWYLIDEIHLSMTHTHYECDTFIDLNKMNNEFVRIHHETCIDHDYQIWRRK